jgi:hypothetical protein
MRSAAYGQIVSRINYHPQMRRLCIYRRGTPVAGEGGASRCDATPLHTNPRLYSDRVPRRIRLIANLVRTSRRQVSRSSGHRIRTAFT